MTRPAGKPAPGRGARSGGAADEGLFGGYRIRLLEAIGRLGSITAAARAVGVSYKTAWDAVDAMNNASERGLVRRVTGGSGGGGTTLTGEGEETVRRCRILREEHRKFMERLEGRMGDVNRLYSLLRRVAMKISARNVLAGKVAEVRRGDVNSEVILQLKGGDTLCSVITNRSVETLGLAPGKEAYGIVKASDVILGKELQGAKISARNLLIGTADRIVHGPVNAEITLTLRGGTVLTSVITETSAKNLSVAKGDAVCALVKASNVILGVDG
ncbi:MAG: TOBE domain-containing protein [Deltaproteobacteria bacterium]|nr:TOBE domain-containing protein [Deltaproteobacteria bacterium]